MVWIDNHSTFCLGHFKCLFMDFGGWQLNYASCIAIHKGQGFIPTQLTVKSKISLASTNALVNREKHNDTDGLRKLDDTVTYKGKRNHV